MNKTLGSRNTFLHWCSSCSFDNEQLPRSYQSIRMKMMWDTKIVVKYAISWGKWETLPSPLNFASILMEDAQWAELNEKWIFRFYWFLVFEIWLFKYNHLIKKIVPKVAQRSETNYLVLEFFSSSKFVVNWGLKRFPPGSWKLVGWSAAWGVCPLTSDIFELNPPSQLVIGYHWLVFLKQVQKR